MLLNICKLETDSRKLWTRGSCRPIGNRYRKTQQITVNHNKLQKRKWDTFCNLTDLEM